MARKRAKTDIREETIPIAFGRALREARTSLNYSQLKLGELTGRHFTYISQLERGKSQPSITTIFMLAEYLDVNPEELVKKTRLIHQKNK